jgi:hypothetical protein
MLEELTAAKNEIMKLEAAIEAIKRRRTKRKLLEYTYSLLTVKENLMRLERKLRRLSALSVEDEEEKAEVKDLIDTTLFAIRERERNVETTKTEVLDEDVRTLRGLLSEISGSLPVEQTIFLLDFSSLPQEIKEEMKMDFEDLRKCYSVEAYRSAVTICGLILETTLSRKYFEVRNEDLVEQGLTLGRIIGRCVSDNVIDEPGIGDICNLINRSRIRSVHSGHGPYRFHPDQTKSLIEFTIGLVKKLFPHASSGASAS